MNYDMKLSRIRRQLRISVCVIAGYRESITIL
nr:MAG TPA: hypothetical protein [Caudoviricetes sp.]